jgi:hypothetical protein
VLVLEIPEHAAHEAREHTGLSGTIPRSPNPTARRQALRWPKTVADVRAEAGRFLRTHPSEDLETARRALKIAAGSFEEAAEHHE